MKFSISVGGLNYHISSITDDFYLLAKDYECQPLETDFHIEVNEDTLKKSSLFNSDFSMFRNETTYILDKVTRHCLDHNRMIIHGAAIQYQNKAYLFIAPSGTGKTTHIRLWKEYLKDEVTIINGDKPMLEMGSEIIVHGTPWKGKEGYGKKISAPLNAITVIRQDKTNTFRKLNLNESLSWLIGSAFYSTEKECGPKIAAYLANIINSTPIYELSCDISKDAFKSCYKGLIKNEYHD